MENYEDFLKENNEMVQKLIEKGIQPVETHNRFGLLYIDRLKLKKSNYKPERAWGYRDCKLMVGTTLLSAVHNPGHDLNAAGHMYYCQQLARKNGWVIRHYGTINASFSKCVGAITIAFTSATKHVPRPSDIRICLQLGSPTLWKDALPGDMLIGHKGEDMLVEAARAMSFVHLDPPTEIIELWAGTPFNEKSSCDATISISPRTFAQEIQKYIEEHMKYEMDSEMRVNLVRYIIDYVE